MAQKLNFLLVIQNCSAEDRITEQQNDLQKQQIIRPGMRKTIVS